MQRRCGAAVSAIPCGRKVRKQSSTDRRRRCACAARRCAWRCPVRVCPGQPIRCSAACVAVCAGNCQWLGGGGGSERCLPPRHNGVQRCNGKHITVRNACKTKRLITVSGLSVDGGYIRPARHRRNVTRSTTATRRLGLRGWYFKPTQPRC